MGLTRACPCCGNETPAPAVWPKSMVRAVVICAACGSILFDYRTGLREPDPDEFAKMDAAPWGPQLREIQRRVFALMARPACPTCGSVPLDLQQFSGEATTPTPGAYWVCAQCLTPAVFVDTNRLAALTPEQAAAAEQDEGVAAAIRFLRDNPHGPPNS